MADALSDVDARTFIHANWRLHEHFMAVNPSPLLRSMYPPCWRSSATTLRRSQAVTDEQQVCRLGWSSMGSVSRGRVVVREALDRLTGDAGDEVEVLVDVQDGEVGQFSRGGDEQVWD